MPIVHFKPIGKKKGTTEGFYSCPLYLYPVRNSQGGSPRSYFRAGGCRPMVTFRVSAKYLRTTTYFNVILRPI